VDNQVYQRNRVIEVRASRLISGRFTIELDNNFIVPDRSEDRGPNRGQTLIADRNQGLTLITGGL
jgi:hypothetical protein